jgi:hypothetical protein
MLKVDPVEPPAKRQPSPEGLGWNPDHDAERHRRGSHISNAAPIFPIKPRRAAFIQAWLELARVYLAGAEGLAGVVCVV